MMSTFEFANKTYPLDTDEFLADFSKRSADLFGRSAAFRCSLGKNRGPTEHVRATPTLGALVSWWFIFSLGHGFPPEPYFSIRHFPSR